MAPRALVSRIDRLVICASPKASCRSVADFAWEVEQSRTRPVDRQRLIVFRNPLRRLVSAYLNKYVEHSRYREASLRLCPDARLETFADFVDELDRHGFRCVDKVHFHPQRRRYRWWRFDRVFDADDLEPLREHVNGLCGTQVAMPFRVRGNRPAAARAEAEPPAADPALLAREDLRALIESGHCPPYACFYNPELEARARRIYRADYRFLDHSLRRGCLGPELHSRLSAL
ncbi:sulfotransferase family protein [Cyanobium sp. FGCU-52]|nr:sulfotransferase family protein [Cyanobium sp. FGCU52]